MFGEGVCLIGYRHLLEVFRSAHTTSSHSRTSFLATCFKVAAARLSRLSLLSLIFALAACSTQLNKQPTNDEHSSTAPPASMSSKDISSQPRFIVAQTPEEADEQLARFGNHWFYGPGMGQTMANVGTVIAFPPYALYLLGNAGLTIAGYEPVYITEALPEKPRRYVLGAYNGVVSIPGRITSAIAGESYDSGNE